MLTIHMPTAGANSRPIGLRFALMTLRLLEHWRSYLEMDHDSALIVLATAAIGMEKFTRVSFPAEHRDIRIPMDVDQLAKCNVRSIAAATGLNRETARRKVNALISAGVLVREGDAVIRLSAEYARRIRTSEMLRSLLEALVHSTNELVRARILTPGAAIVTEDTGDFM